MTVLENLNLKGDLFATAACFVVQAAIRLTSSLILTRILPPEAYGVVTIILSVAYVLEMLADIGVTVFVVRDKNAEESIYLNTAWTLRLLRSLLNASLLFFCAQFIANSIYDLPTLVAPLRVFSVWFLICGLESMSFPIAIRRKRSRIPMYSELFGTFASAIFTVIYCHYSRDYWGIIYGVLLSRLITTILSYQFYKEFRPRLQINGRAVQSILGTTKFTLPSGLLTLALSQFDKIIFLRLFDLRALGLYGLAGNIAGPIESLILKISQMVLYPHCAHNFRDDPNTFGKRYYKENIKLFISIMIVPGIVCGASKLIITVLYPTRYFEAAVILQAFMIRAAVISLSSPAEDLLVAAGEYHVILVGSILRVIWMLIASLIGYYLFGFTGFVYGLSLNPIPALIFNYWRQQRRGLLEMRYELLKGAFLICVGIFAYLVSNAVESVWPLVKIRT